MDELEAYERHLGITEASVWHEFTDVRKGRSTWLAPCWGTFGSAMPMWVRSAAKSHDVGRRMQLLDFWERSMDASPLRRAELMPGTRTPMVLPEQFRLADPPSMVLVTAWKTGHDPAQQRAGTEGHWVTPLPGLSFSCGRRSDAAIVFGSTGIVGRAVVAKLSNGA